MNIALDRISFAYPDRYRSAVPVLRDLSLDIRDGECLGILGPEGSGKSTLLQVLDALLRPDKGSVRVDGIDLWSASGQLRNFRRRAGIAFQFPEQQFLCDSVAEELAYTADRFGVEDRLAPAEALARFGLDYGAVSARSPFLLSMGEARRVALATLLVHRPQLLLFDEPTSGLDGPGTDMVIRVVQSLQGEGKTIVVTSHDVDVLAETTSRVAVIADGRLAHEGETRSVLGDASLLERYGFSLPGAVEVLRGLERQNRAEVLQPVRLEEIRNLLTRRGPARAE
jgi:ABC-type glutathione transport system ATPase component